MSSLQSQNLEDDIHLSNIKNISSSRFLVYKAHDTQSNIDIALKAFPPKKSAQIYFTREKYILSHLSHPNIIKYIRTINEVPLIATHPNDSYLCLEFAKYGDMYEIVARKGPIKEKLVRSLFKQLLEGVYYLHSKNISHLDLKLENILVDKNLDLKIIDFDLAQPLNGDKLLGKGTAGYRAPEVKDGSCTIFSAADVYSLGIVLFIMLSGMPPYTEIQHDSEYSWDKFYLAMRYRNEKFWAAHASPKGDAHFYSTEFMDLFNKMTAESPEERLTLKEVAGHSWTRGDCYTGDEYQVEMEKYLGDFEENGAQISIP